MKKTLLSLLMFLALPLMAQVSNPSIIPVAGAPSGACSQNLPDQQVVYLGTVYTCQSGTWAELSGGGGGSPAGANGNPQINASSSFGADTNVLVAQSGDTIASIEAACTSAPCIYKVNVPQTITLAASHAMNSNVWVQFGPSGKWTVNGAFTLSNVQVVGGSALTQHFAGSSTVALSTWNTLVPVEWFGAVGDWNGSTGTNNLTAIQAALNATQNGQILYAGGRNYAIAGTLTIPRSYVGMKGTRAARGGLTGLVETVSGDSAVTDTGNAWGYFEDFSIISSVAQASPASGFTCNGGAGLLVKDVIAQDFFYDFNLHNCPSGAAGFFNDVAQFTSISSALTSPVGYYMPSTDGLAEDSLTIRDSSMTTTPTGGPASAIGALITGTAVNDIDLFNFNVAGGNGIEVIYTGSGSGASCSDIHIKTPTIDNFVTYGIYVNGCTAAQTGSDEISGGWVVSGTATSSTAAVYILNSSGVSVNHVQIGAHANYTAQAANGVEVSGGSGNSIVGNTFLNQGQPYNLTGTTSGNTISSNTFINNSGGNLNGGQVGSSATYNTVANNTWSVTSGTVSTGFYFGGNNNTYVGNTCTTGVTTCILDSGTGNGLSAPLSIAKSGTTGANVLQMTIPSLATGTGDYVGMYMGTTVALNNLLVMNFTNAGGSGSSSNYADFGIYNSGSTYEDAWPNGSFTFGQTTPAAGPANGIAVGTTGQFQVSGAGAVTAPSIAINGGTAITSSTTANSQVVTVAAGTRALGYTTLSSGTITISNAAACTASATCVYKLTNCGTNSSAALGTLTIGTITAGTSFVINSESAAAALVTTDNSHVCWQIN